MRVRTFLIVGTCVLASTSGSVADPPDLRASPRVTLERPRVTADTVVLGGRAPRAVKVRILRRSHGRWVVVAADRAGRRGRYRVVIDRPARRWVVRAAIRGDRSRKRIVPAADSRPPGDPPPSDPPPSDPPPSDPPPSDPPPSDPPPSDPPPSDPPPSDPPPADDACGTRLQKADGSLWECTFVDSFSGSALDTAKWLAADSSVTGITSGTEGCYVNAPWTIAVADGALRLSAQRTADPFVCQKPVGQFTTDRAAAAVTTRGRFSQAFGRFEFRARMPDLRVQGAHTTLWLYPNKHLYGVWPLSGEIDVAEWYSAKPDQVYPSTHYLSLLGSVFSGQDGIIVDTQRYHTYAVEWTPARARFYYDGRLVFDHVWSPLAPLLGSQPFDQPFNVVLSQVWGGLWNAPTAATPDRVTLTVDWVKVWK